MIIVDSSVWVAYFNGVPMRETDRLDSLLQRELVVVGDLVLAEVLQGFRNDRDYRLARKLLLALPFSPMVGQDIALRSAENYRVLRSRGVTLRKTIDVIIGTFCIVNKLPLLHADRDFDPLVRHLGLRIVS